MTEAMRVLVGLLGDVRNKLNNSGISNDSEAYLLLEAALDRLERSLERRPTILVAGEANSGKTSVANMLAGVDALPSAVVANTSVSVRLRQGKTPSVTALTSDGRVPLSLASNDDALPQFLYSGLKSIDVEWPAMQGENFEVLDTPPWPIATQLIREADILLWCSVAARPWTESERQAIANMPARLKKRSILVVTHEDALAESDKARVLERYREHAGEHFSKIVMIDATGDKSRSAIDAIGPLLDALNNPASDQANLLFPGSSNSEHAGNEVASGTSPSEEQGAHIAGQKISSRQKLRGALDPLLELFWNHRSVTGRRLCRHLAHTLAPILPAVKIAEHPASAYENDPEGALFANIASRLATA